MKRAALALTTLSLAAQTPSAEEELMALLNTPVTVASRKAMSARESPGVVTLITREEIQAAGARDLMDVLALVPGFDFGLDNNGVTGPSMRGIWGFEGKILLLWDGVEMNETLYGNLPMGNHYPVDQIQRVEIIRGPGSALYGGFAEVAVIQVTTLGAEELRGVAGGLGHGQGEGGPLRDHAHLLYGWSEGETSVTLAAFGGDGTRSNGTYSDGAGSSGELGRSNTLEPLFINLGFRRGGFRLRAILDAYQGKEVDGYGEVLARPVLQRFRQQALDVRYDWRVSQNLTLTPYAVHRQQKPWWLDDGGQDYRFRVRADRTKVGLVAAWAAAADWDVQGGYEFLRDQAEIPEGNTDLTAFLDGSTKVAYQDHAIFAQAQYQGAVNFTLGARYEHHSEAGGAFVPRLAITKASGPWHVKFLAAQSFRTPNVLNINAPLNPGQKIEAEKTTSIELEAGYQIGRGLLSVNAFSMKVDKPLVYLVVDPVNQGYFNEGSVSTRGIEVQYQARLPWGFVNANLHADGLDNKVGAWQVPGDSGRSLGLANRHASVLVGWRFRPGWSFNPSVKYIGARQAFMAPDLRAGVPGLVLAERKAEAVLGGTLVATFGKVTAVLSVADASDRAVPFFQPYDGGHAELPGPGREVTVKVRYGF